MSFCASPAGTSTSSTLPRSPSASSSSGQLWRFASGVQSARTRSGRSATGSRLSKAMGASFAWLSRPRKTYRASRGFVPSTVRSRCSRTGRFPVQAVPPVGFPSSCVLTPKLAKHPLPPFMGKQERLAVEAAAVTDEAAAGADDAMAGENDRDGVGAVGGAYGAGGAGAPGRPAGELAVAPGLAVGDAGELGPDLAPGTRCPRALPASRTRVAHPRSRLRARGSRGRGPGRRVSIPIRARRFRYSATGRIRLRRIAIRDGDVADHDLVPGE